MTIEARAARAAERLRREVVASVVPDARSIRTRARRRRAATPAGLAIVTVVAGLWLVGVDDVQNVIVTAPPSSVPDLSGSASEASTSMTDRTSGRRFGDGPPASVPFGLGQVGKLTFPEGISTLDANVSVVGMPQGQFVEVRFHEAPPAGYQWLMVIVDGLATSATRTFLPAPGEVWGSRVSAADFGPEVEVQVVATTEDGVVLAATTPAMFTLGPAPAPAGPPAHGASSFTTDHLPRLEVSFGFVDDPTNGFSFMVTVPSVPEEATYLAYIIDGKLDSIRDIVPGRVQDIRAENLPEEFTLQVVATGSKPTAGLARGDKSMADVAPEVQASAVAASPEYRIVKP